jgi:hypothetical protein
MRTMCVAAAEDSENEYREERMNQIESAIELFVSVVSLLCSKTCWTTWMIRSRAAGYIYLLSSPTSFFPPTAHCLGNGFRKRSSLSSWKRKLRWWQIWLRKQTADVYAYGRRSSKTAYNSDMSADSRIMAIAHSSCSLAHPGYLHSLQNPHVTC